MKVAALVLGLVLLVAVEHAVARCSYHDAHGCCMSLRHWITFVNYSVGRSTTTYSWCGSVQRAFLSGNEEEEIDKLTLGKVEFHPPNIAFLSGNGEEEVEGTWTMVESDALELHVGGLSYVAFFAWRMVSAVEVEFNCSAISVGLARSESIGYGDANWHCFLGEKLSTTYSHTRDTVPVVPQKGTAFPFAIPDRAPIAPMTLEDIDDAAENAHAAVRSEEMVDADPKECHQIDRIRYMQTQAELPLEWDWRNVDGKDFVGAARAQGTCSCCYAFVFSAMLEARVRVATQNSKQPLLSPQSIVSCSPYDAGCLGGFPLLSARWAQESGVQQEQCFRYAHRDASTGMSCDASHCRQSDERYYVRDYGYVGGYLGNCTTEALMHEIVTGGPVAAGFLITEQFRQYSSGIFTTGRAWPPSRSWRQPDHALLLVGYGSTASGIDYWIAKNSWGTGWGAGGFVLLRRGVDESLIEQMGVWATPDLRRQ